MSREGKGCVHKRYASTTGGKEGPIIQSVEPPGPVPTQVPWLRDASRNRRHTLALTHGPHEGYLEAAMAIFEDVFRGGNIVTGLAIGVGFALLAPVVKPFVRPLAKTAIKAGLAAYDQGRVAVAELTEHAGDIVAEVRTEMAEEPTNGEDREHKSSQRNKFGEAKHGGRTS